MPYRLDRHRHNGHHGALARFGEPRGSAAGPVGQTWPDLRSPSRQGRDLPRQASRRGRR